MLRELTSNELSSVAGGTGTYYAGDNGSGWVDNNGNGTFETGVDDLVVTASKNADGGWQVGFAGPYGVFGQISVTNIDVFLGLGWAWPPGMHLDYENEGQLSGVEVDPNSGVYNIGVIQTVNDMAETLQGVQDQIQSHVDHVSQELIEYMYEPYYQQQDEQMQMQAQ